MRSVRKWIAFAALVCFVVGAVGLAWMFNERPQLGTEPVDIEKKIDASTINNVVITGDTANVMVMRAPVNEVRVRIYGTIVSADVGYVKIDMHTDGDTATFDVQTTKQFQMGIDVVRLFNLIGSGSDQKPKIEVELPDKSFRSVQIKTDTGNLNVQQARADRLRLQSSTGNIEVVQYISDALEVTSDTGNVSLQKVGSPITVDTDTGNVKISGDEPRWEMTLSSDTGNVSVLMNAAYQLGIDLKSDTGRTNANFPDMKTDLNEKHRLLATIGMGKPLLKATTSTGNISVGLK